MSSAVEKRSFISLLECNAPITFRPGLCTHSHLVRLPSISTPVPAEQQPRERRWNSRCGLFHFASTSIMDALS